MITFLMREDVVILLLLLSQVFLALFVAREVRLWEKAMGVLSSSLYEANRDLRELERTLNRQAKVASGVSQKALQRSAISAKFAERAFAMASQANVTLVGIANLLQRRPAPLSNKDLAKNEAVARKLESVFGESQIDFIRPLLSDEELEILDRAIEERDKATQ